MEKNGNACWTHLEAVRWAVPCAACWLWEGNMLKRMQIGQDLPSQSITIHCHPLSSTVIHCHALPSITKATTTTTTSIIIIIIIIIITTMLVMIHHHLMYSLVSLKPLKLTGARTQPILEGDLMGNSLMLIAMDLQWMFIPYDSAWRVTAGSGIRRSLLLPARKKLYQHRPEAGHRETKERNPHYTPVPQSVKVTAVFCLRGWKIIAQKLSCISYGENCELNWTPHQMNLQFFSECTRPVGWKHDPDHSLLAPALRPSPVQDSQTRACKCAHNFFVTVAGPQVTDTRKPARLLFLSRKHGKTATGFWLGTKERYRDGDHVHHGGS